MHGIHRHAVRDAAIADAKRNDPTRTFSLRAKMRAEGDRRWQTLAQVLRSALIEHDIIGQRGMSKLPFGDKTEGFSMWLREELRQKVFGHDGRWLKPYVQQAAAHAQTRADEMLGTRDANPNHDPKTGEFASGGGGHGPELKGDKTIADLKGNRIAAPRTFYRASNEGDQRRIQTGDPNWDSHLFVASNVESAKPYGKSIERIDAKPEAKILYEGTKEFRSLAAGLKGNLLNVSSGVTKRAAGKYDAVWFKRQSDLGTAILNRGAFVFRGKTADAVLLDASVDPARVTAMESLAVSELAGVCAAAQQQITRQVTHCMMANATPTATANAAAGVVKVMRNRTRAMSEYIVAKTHATSTLSAFRSAGIRRVGIDPERIRKTTRDKILLKDRRYSGPGSRSREETPSARTIGRIEEVQEGLEEELGAGEVDVVNGPDPCPICEEIADDGPYDLDEAEDLIPQHPFCMCAFTLAGEDDDDTVDFNPNHDPHSGQFASGGGGGVKADSFDGVKTLKKQWFGERPHQNDVAGTMADAKEAQDRLGSVVKDIAGKLGVGFRDPGVKADMDRIMEKAAERGGIHNVSDLVRASFTVDHPEQAEAITNELSKHYQIGEEPWKQTNNNYIDKALSIRDKNGAVGEVQILESKMIGAKKEGGGHKMYKEAQRLQKGIKAGTSQDPVHDAVRIASLEQSQRVLYGNVIKNYPQEWKSALEAKPRERFKL